MDKDRDIKIDKTKKKIEWFSQYVDRFIENARTYADDPAIYMHNHALSAIDYRNLPPYSDLPKSSGHIR